VVYPGGSESFGEAFGMTFNLGERLSPLADRYQRQGAAFGRALVAAVILTFLVITAGGWRAAGWLERVEYEETCSYWWSNRGVDGYVSPEDQALGKDRYTQACMTRQREEERQYLASSDPDNHVCKWQDGAGCPPNPDLRIPWLIFMEIAGLGIFAAWGRKRLPTGMNVWRVTAVIAAVPSLRVRIRRRQLTTGHPRRAARPCSMREPGPE
jgi:hypothetical protein